MKKIFASLVIFVISFLFYSVSDASAKVVMMEKGYYLLQKDETLSEDLYVGAQTVDLQGVINGDVYIGAETVRITGVINGDLHVGAMNFNLNGKVRDDAYVLAGSVLVSGAEIGESFHVGSGNISVDADTSIGRSLIAGAGSVNMDSKVANNVLVGAGTISLNSKVGGEARLAGGEITLGSDTTIEKDLYYMVDEEENNDLTMVGGARVVGQTHKTENKYITEKEMQRAKRGVNGAFQTANLFFSFLSFVGAFIVGYLGLRYFPKSFTEPSKFVKNSFFKSLGVGFLVTVAAIPVFLILLLTGVGVPLAGVLFLILMLNIYMAKLVVGLTLGSVLGEKFEKKMSVFGYLALGLLIFYLLKMIPVLGFLVSLVTLWVGLGALTLHYKSTLASK